MSYPKGTEGKPVEEWLTETRDTTHATDPRKVHRAQADDTSFRNLQGVFNDALAAVRVSEPKRDVSQNQRFRYERNWDKLRAAANNYATLANARGIKVLVPPYYPPAQTAEQWTEYQAPPPQDGRYEETRGHKIGLGRPDTGVVNK